MDCQWVTSIRDQCQSLAVPFFFKQWGGVQKKKAGRELEGRTWNEMPVIHTLNSTNSSLFVGSEI
jgi:protein gp37